MSEEKTVELTKRLAHNLLTLFAQKVNRQMTEKQLDYLLSINIENHSKIPEIFDERCDILYSLIGNIQSIAIIENKECNEEWHTQE